LRDGWNGLDEVNRRLEPLTGFQAKAVSGYVPGILLFGLTRGPRGFCAYGSGLLSLAPGLPEIAESDLRSFMEAGR